MKKSDAEIEVCYVCGLGLPQRMYWHSMSNGFCEGCYRLYGEILSLDKEQRELARAQELKR